MSKYNNKKIEYDGIIFDSIKEKNRYIKLKELEDQGVIHSLELQKKFILQEKFKLGNKTIREISYIADFVYYENDQMIVEDCKGFRTTEYKIKKKMFQYRYKLDIKET